MQALTSRRRLTVVAAAGVLVPPLLALLGYQAAGRPHVDCGETAATGAFYRVAIPFFAVGYAIIAGSLAQLGKGPRILAGLIVVLAVDALLPGALHRPAGAVVIALGIVAVVGSVVLAPAVAVVLVATVVVSARRRHASPTRRELRLNAALLAAAAAIVQPAVILLVSLNADPICFSF